MNLVVDGGIGAGVVTAVGVVAAPVAVADTVVCEPVGHTRHQSRFHYSMIGLSLGKRYIHREM